jgi:hypothetical protein
MICVLPDDEDDTLRYVIILIDLLVTEDFLLYLSVKIKSGRI